MTSFRIPFAALLLAFAPMAWAQQSAPMTTNVEQQMSADQFKAAGLDKLSPKELAALNAWLQQKVTAETAVAVAVAREEGRKAIVEENRGFFDFGSKEPIVSNIAGEFTGFGKGRTYTLKNGQVWEQIEAASLTGVLERIIFFNEENHYTIAELRTEAGRGVPSAPSKEATVTITG